MSRFEPTLLLAWTMLTAALVFGEIGGPVRVAFALTFLGVAPGLAVTRLCGFTDLETRLLVAVPVSLAVTAIVSGVLVYVGLPSWDLGLSIMISLTVAAVIADLARPELGLGRVHELQLPGKLDDETRQARMVDALQAGGSLSDAAEAAGVSRSTLYRSLRRSEALRRAVEIASHGTVDPDLLAGMDDAQTPKDS
jgi:hypothetical protein